MENKHASQAIHPDHVEIPRSCLLLFDLCILNPANPHSVFSLRASGPWGLHSTFSILSSLPILQPRCSLCDLTGLSGGRPIAQNKANFKIGKIALNPYCEKPYDQIPPHSCLATPKNKANSPRPPGPLGGGSPPGQTQSYAVRSTLHAQPPDVRRQGPAAASHLCLGCLPRGANTSPNPISCSQNRRLRQLPPPESSLIRLQSGSIGRGSDILGDLFEIGRPAR